MWGLVPYRDFVLIQPPGIMLVLAPFALLGRLTHDTLGFEAARVFTMVVGSLNGVLVVWISRRAGLAAAAAGGLVYAIWTPAALSETTIRLEPWVTFGILLALAILTRSPGRPSARALLWAGAALGLAASVKIWAVAPAVLVMFWVWRRWGGRALARTALGTLAAASLIDLPFVLAAPTAMIRMVVLDQLGRSRTPGGAAARIASTLLPGTSPPPGWTPGVLVTVLALIGLTGLILTCGRTLRGRFALSLLGLELVVLVMSPSFYSYYPAFAAPGVALAAANAIAWLTDRRAAHDWRRARLGKEFGREIVSVALVVVALLGGLGATVVDSHAVMSTPIPATSLERSAATSRCVTSDSPDALILSNVFTRDLRRGCQVSVDLTGLTYDRDALPARPDGAVPRRSNRPWQRDLAGYLFSGQTIFIMRPSADGFDAASKRQLANDRVLCRGLGFLFLRDGSRRTVAKGTSRRHLAADKSTVRHGPPRA